MRKDLDELVVVADRIEDEARLSPVGLVVEREADADGAIDECRRENRDPPTGGGGEDRFPVVKMLPEELQDTLGRRRDAAETG